MTPADRYAMNREIQAAHQAWAAGRIYTPDPQYANNDPSQYPETGVVLAAGADAESALWDRIEEIQAKYGYRRGIGMGATA